MNEASEADGRNRSLARYAEEKKKGDKRKRRHKSKAQQLAKGDSAVSGGISAPDEEV